jgi:hypothetical protein
LLTAAVGGAVVVASLAVVTWRRWWAVVAWWWAVVAWCWAVLVVFGCDVAVLLRCGWAVAVGVVTWPSWCVAVAVGVTWRRCWWAVVVVVVVVSGVVVVVVVVSSGDGGGAW